MYISRVVIYDNYSQHIHSPLLSTILTSSTSLAPIPLPLRVIHMAHLSSSANMALYRRLLCNLFFSQAHTSLFCSKFNVLFHTYLLMQLVFHGLILHVSLTKLMVSHDLLHSMVTKQIAFNQRDSKSISNFECETDRCCQVLYWSLFFLVSKLGTLDTISFN